MARDPGSVERLYLRLLHRLAPPGRRLLRGPARPFYTEKQWERKLRLEDQGAVPPEGADPDPLDGYALLRGQITDLLRASGLSARQVQVATLRLNDLTLLEIAQELSLSERRVGQILHSLKGRLGPSLADAEGRLRPDAARHYGWQEVLLQTTRRRGPVRRCFR